MLTESIEQWAAWRGVTALTEEHDLDSVAPEGVWASVIDATRVWAERWGIEAVVCCRHAPGQLILVGCGGRARETLLQVDVVAQKLVHGAPVWSAEDLLECVDATPGIRRVRPGSEGVARLLARRADGEGRRLTALDPAGATALATRLGLRARLATSTRPGATTLLECLLAVRPFRAPLVAARSFASDHRRRRCGVLAALRADRRAPRDLERWLHAVARDHEVFRA